MIRAIDRDILDADRDLIARERAEGVAELGPAGQ